MKTAWQRLFAKPPSPFERRQWALFYLTALLCILANGWGQIFMEGKGDLCTGDSLAFYTASYMLQQDKAVSIYNPEEYIAQQAVLCEQGKGFFWVYNPTTFLPVYPMAWLSMIDAYLLYGAGGLVAMVLSLRYLLKREFTVLAPFVLACPAWLFTVNMGHALPLLLIGAVWMGFACMDRQRSLWAGFWFGLLIMKPQYGILLPVLLAGLKQWRVFFYTGLWALAFCIFSALLFGIESWQAFFNMRTVAVDLLETTLYEPLQCRKKVTRAVITPFELIRQTGLGLHYVWALYGLSLLAMATWVWRSARHYTPPVAVMVFCIATLVISPWMHYYDLVWLNAMLAFLLLAMPLQCGSDRQWALLWVLLLCPLLVALTPWPSDLSLGALLYLLPPLLVCIYVQRKQPSGSADLLSSCGR